MTLNCIAVDDEELALELLEDNIKQVPFLRLVGKCNNAFEALEVLQTEKVDLIFMDIQMPGLTGIQFLKSLSTSPLVIFITAYEQYALDGFELDVVDYLLKPVSFERFLKAANKALDKYSVAQLALQTPNNEYFFVNSEYSLVKVKYDDITYIEGLKDYIKIYLKATTRPVITRMTMKSIEEKLIPYNFMRVHKSFIISLDKIVSIRNLKVMIENATIPISEQNIDDLLTRIGSK